MRLTLTLAVVSVLTFGSTASAQDGGATVDGSARCETDGSWSVDWTISVPSRGGLWSITPGMYQDPRPWQPDSVPFTVTTAGHGDQPDATIGITYGWADGPTGLWATGTAVNPGCAVASPEPAVVEPVQPQPVATPVGKIERFRAAVAALAGMIHRPTR